MFRQAFASALLMSALLASTGQCAEPKSWRAGAARVDITPGTPMWLSGYAGRDKPAEGTLHRLWAKALVLEDADGRRVVLVTMDLVGIPRDISVAVCAELKKRHGLPREAILLSTSHTHTGPIVGSNLNAMYAFNDAQQQRVRAYAADLQAKLVEVVGAALAKLAPAQLAWGAGRVTFAVNRRNNKEPEVPRLRELGQLKGPVDHDVPVLSVRDLQGKVRAVVFGYACHATVLNFYQWSGDYPGFAQLAVEKMYPDAVALFWAGCGADQNPLPRRSVALAESYGERLAEEARAVLDAPMTPLGGRLATVYAEIPLAFADLPTRDQLVEDSTSTNRYVASRARMLLDQLAKEGSLRGSYPYPVQTWQLGPELTWVALGGEVVVDYSLRLKKELGPGAVWVTGYANDVMAYIPSLRVLKEGGYECGGSMVYYGLPTVWAPQVEETIISTVVEQVRKVRSAARE